MRFGSLPRLQIVFQAIQPVILAIIAQAIWTLSKSAIKNCKLAVLSVSALALYLISGNEILVLFVIAIAIGQFTPGPVFTTATFIGFFIAGSRGAVAATLGIFIPAFFFVAVSAPFLSKIRRSKWAGAFLDGLNVASLSLMAGAAFSTAGFGNSVLGTAGLAILAFFVSLILLAKFKINSVWLILIAVIWGLISTPFFGQILTLCYL